MTRTAISRLGTIAFILVGAACGSTTDGDAAASGGASGTGGAGGIGPSGGSLAGGATLSGGGGGTVGTSVGGSGGVSGSGGATVDAATEMTTAEASMDAALEASAPRDVSVDSSYPAAYRGAPYSDAVVTGGAQRVPGRIQAEYYDVVAGSNPLKGQEGVTFHDTDAANNGAVEKSDAASAYVNNFRTSESVDITFTHPGWDDTTFNFVPQQALQLYVGWIKQGEWLYYTVDVAQTGLYAVDVMYTCNGGGALEITLDDNPAQTTGLIALTNTAPGNNGQAPADHAYHIWNKMVAGGTIALPAGKHLLKVRFDSVGNGVNLDWIDLRLL
jgi:hypothetical protein